MNALTRQQTEEWARTHSYALDERGLPVLRGSGELESFAIPGDAGKRVHMVRHHAEVFRVESECCVWIDDWGVWPSGQWEHLFHRFRKSYGIDASLEDAPAMRVPAVEFEATVSIAVNCALMLWDCYILGASGRPFVFYSHDEIGRRRSSPSNG
jgi:hypothetical protein